MALSSGRNEFGRLLERVSQVRRAALVGAGGKTTLMYALGDRLAAAGKRVVVTTTTRIWKPADRPVCESLAELETVSSFPAVYGAPAPGGKLALPADFDADALEKLADYVLMEADGSRGMPCKAPRAGEPVFVPHTDLVLGVVGLSCLGRPLRDVCFGLNEAEELLGVDADHVLTERDLAAILMSPQGTRKNVACPYAVVLNQCDVEDGWKKAARVREYLRPAPAYATTFRQESLPLSSGAL